MLFASEREGKALPPQLSANWIAFGNGSRLDHAVFHKRDTDSRPRKEFSPALHDGIKYGLGITKGIC